MLKIAITLISVFTLFCAFAQPGGIHPSTNTSYIGLSEEQRASTLSGLPAIGFPLAEIQGKGVSLPIALSYQAGGIRVDQEASAVGLGWTLHHGGVIGRIIKDEDDLDFSRTKAWKIANPDPNELPFNIPLLPDTADIEPDLFFFSFPGGSGTFIYRKVQNQHSAFFIKDGAYGVQWRTLYDPAQNTWIITTDDGFRYEFGATERTVHVTGTGSSESTALNSLQNTIHAQTARTTGRPGINHVTTAWYLTRVIPPYATDTLHLSYRLDGEAMVDVRHFYKEKLRYNGEVVEGPVHLFEAVKTQQFIPIISEISTSQQRIQFRTSARLEDRTAYDTCVMLSPSPCNMPGRDATGDQIQQISGNTLHYWYPRKIDGFTLSVRNEGAWTVHSSVDFQYDHFNTGTNRGALSRRLRLTGFVHRDATGQAISTYSFQYNQATSLPDKDSRQRDHWGLFNGSTAQTGSSLLASVDSIRHFIPALQSALAPWWKLSAPRSGTNRASNPSTVTASMLQRVLLPTGGTIQYEWEANTYRDSLSNGITQFGRTVQGGGVRIRRITTDDGSGGRTHLQYDYAADQTRSSSGNLSAPIYSAYGLEVTHESHGPYYWLIRIGTTRTPLITCQYGTPVSYSQVTVFYDSVGKFGKTVYLSSRRPVLMRYHHEELAPKPNTDAFSTVTQYKRVNNAYEKDSEIFTYYTEEYIGLATGFLNQQIYPFQRIYHQASTSYTNQVLSRVHRQGGMGYDEQLTAYEYDRNTRYPLRTIQYTSDTTAYIIQNLLTGTFRDEIAQARKSVMLWFHDMIRLRREYDSLQANYTPPPPIPRDPYACAEAYMLCVSTAFANDGFTEHCDEAYLACLNADNTQNPPPNPYAGPNPYPIVQPQDTVRRLYFDPHYLAIQHLVSQNILRYPVEQATFYAVKSGITRPALDTGIILQPVALWQTPVFLSGNLVKYRILTHANRSFVRPVESWDATGGQETFRIQYTAGGRWGMSRVLHLDTVRFVHAAQYRLRAAYEYDPVQRHVAGETRTDGPRSAFLYGYGQTVQVAQALNASPAQIAYTSFETTTDKGQWFYPVRSQSTVQSGRTGRLSFRLSSTDTICSQRMQPGQYILSYWLQNDTGTPVITPARLPHIQRRETTSGWTYVERVIQLGTAGHIRLSGTGVVDELRLYPADARMSTATYIPFVGVDSQMDANNRAAFREYDAAGRLKLIRDHDGNIIFRQEVQIR